jgi:hypothetical protein
MLILTLTLTLILPNPNPKTIPYKINYTISDIGNKTYTIHTTRVSYIILIIIIM